MTPARIQAVIKAARASAKPIIVNDPATPGLRLYAGQRRATWYCRLRDPSMRIRDFRLGYYPHTGLREARVLAAAMTHRVRFEGLDPVAEARAKRQRQVPTLGQLIERYGALKLKDPAAKGARSWTAQMRPAIERVFRPHLKTDLDALTVQELQQTADDYASPKSASFSVRCLLTVLKWGAEPNRKLVNAELLYLKPVVPKPQRNRWLSRAELAALLPVLRASTSPYAAAMRFILLTGARRNEVASARWKDMDLAVDGTWFIPDPKNGQPFIVPLSRQATLFLRELRPTDFPDPDGYVFTIDGRPLGKGFDAATDELQAASGTTNWHRHDLRRTASNWMGHLGVVRSVVDAALNHTPSKLSLTYNESTYLPQVRDGLQRLADHLDLIERGGAEVVPLRA